MAEPTQTIAAPSFASRYSSFSPSTGYNAKPWSNLFALLVGMPKVGKSCVLESNPDLLRIDFDRAGTTNPQTRALTVPALRDGNGQTIIIKKEWLDKLVDQLCDDALKKNPARPKTIAFDTVDKMMEMLCEELAHQKGVKAFHELPTIEYGTIYAQVADYCNKLVQHGYGLWLTSHLINKKVDIGDQSKMSLDLTIRDALFTRIRGGLDLIVAVEKGEEIKTKTIPKLHPVTKQPMLNPNGTPMVDRLEQTSEPFVDFVFNQSRPTDPFAANFSQLVCSRIKGLPDRVRLPRTDAWALLESLYEKAAVADGASLLS